MSTPTTKPIPAAAPVTPVETAPIAPAQPRIVLPPSARANSSSPFGLKKRGRPSGVATILLAPGVSRTLDESGDRFVVLSTNLPLAIQPQPAGRMEIYYQGLTGKFPNPFDFLTIKNPSTSTSLVLTIWVGFEDLANYTPALLPVTSMELLTVIASTGTIQPVSKSDLYFRKGWLYAYNAFTAGVPVNNGANIQVGKSKTYQPDQLAPGQYISYEFPPGQVFNLANVYIQGTAGDGIFFTGT